MALMGRYTRLALVAAAGALWGLASMGFATMFQGFSHTGHPVALLGAAGVPRAMAFNAIGFVAPGLLVATAALALRSALVHGGWPARIGAQLLLLSALGFTVQGVLPLDPSDLDAQASRLHATAWSAWWIAFLPGAALLASRDRRLLLVGLCMLAAVAISTVALPPGLAQRVGMAAWFIVVAVAMHPLEGAGAGRREAGRSG